MHSWIIRSLFGLLLIFLSSPACSTVALAAPSEGQGPTNSGFSQLVEYPAQALTLAARRGQSGFTVLHVGTSDALWPAPTPGQGAAAGKLLAVHDYQHLAAAGEGFGPDGSRLYWPDNVLAMAHSLGLVKRVYWVVPVIAASTAKGLEDLRNYLTQRRSPWSDNAGTRLTVKGRVIEGTLSGVPVTIGRLRDFSPPATPLWLDIDLDFFVQRYQNPVASSYSGLLAGFVDALHQQHLSPAVTTVCYGGIDLDQRFLGPWLQRLLAEPGLIAQGPPPAWRQREEALYQLFFQQRKEALAIIAKLASHHPQAPDLQYALGLLQIQAGNESAGRKALAQAAALDPVYARGFISASTELKQTGRRSETGKYMELAAKAAPDDPQILAALADYYFEQGTLEKSAAALHRLITLRAAGPEIFSRLGDIAVRQKDFQTAARMYQQALTRYRKAPGSFLPPATWVRLGLVLERLDRKPAALAVYRDYLDWFRKADPPRQDQIEARIKELSR